MNAGQDDPGEFEAFEDPELEKRDAEQAHRLVARLVEELGDTYPLNVLTDAGVLPNYAFPEPGVRLESVIQEQRALDQYWKESKSSSR